MSVLQVLHSGDLICEGFIKMLAEPAKPEEPKKDAIAAEPTEAAAPAADAAPAEVCLKRPLCVFNCLSLHVKVCSCFRLFTPGRSVGRPLIWRSTNV